MLEPEVTSADARKTASASLLSPEEVLDRAESERWRREVATRVQQHRARRRRFDPNASLDLNFPTEPCAETTSVAAEELPSVSIQQPDQQESESPISQLLSAARTSRLLRPPKIIRFPKQSAESAASLRARREDFELAEPILDAPRILDAPEPEQMQLISTFADIDLEPASAVATPTVDLPPMPADLGRRAWSGLTDAILVLAAVTMFAFTFWKLAEVVPTSRVTWLYALAVGTILWVMFQYTFLVYGKGTPGMRAAGLGLCDFAGRRASLLARRSRAFATALSGLSLGLGFAWSLVDEDTLGWHDRISGTYLRSSDQVVG